MNTDEHVKDFYEMMIENNLIPMITFPSRVTETSATLTDHIFVNDKTHTSMQVIQARYALQQTFWSLTSLC